MAEKVAKLGVSREKDFMYYVKDGGVWKVQRKQPGVPKGRPEKVADGGFEMDTNYIYFVDRDGDVARAKRAVGGQKRKKRRAKAAKRRPARKAKKTKAKGGKKAKAKKAQAEEGPSLAGSRKRDGSSTQSKGRGGYPPAAFFISGGAQPLAATARPAT